MTKPMCLKKSPHVLIGEKKNMLGVVARPLVTHLIVMVHTVSCNN